MEYLHLGNSSLHISRIGFGCMSLKKENDKTENIILQAIDYGINFFDTADLYEKGENEILLGKALKNNRSKIVLATKVGNEWKKDGSGWDWNPRKEYILKAVEESLKRLQTDHIDLYQLHGGTIDDPIDETIEAFEILIQQGKIRFYGISSIRPNVIRKWVESSNMVSVMMQYSLLDRRPEEGMHLLQEKNIGLLARGSLAQGLLVNKPAKNYLGYDEHEVKKIADIVQSLSKNRSPSQTAIQFVLKNPDVTSAVVGIRTSDQLSDAVKSIENNLSKEEYLQLKNVLPQNVYSEHR